MRPSEDAAAGAAALDEVLAKAVPGRPPDEVDDDERVALWSVLTDGGWPLLGAHEAQGGFGLGLRDLVETARVVGRHGTPAPLVQTMALFALADPALGGDAIDDRPRAVAIPRRHRPDTSRVVHGAFPGVVPASSGAGQGAPDQFAPTLHLLDSDAAARSLPPALRHSLTVLWTAEAVGAAEYLLDEAVRYARVREQFGEPIGSFQAIKHLLADALLAVQEAFTAVVWATNSPEPPPAGIRLALDRCVVVSETAGQVHGGIGMTWELGHHFRTRHIIALRDLVEDLLALEGEPS